MLPRGLREGLEKLGVSVLTLEGTRTAPDGTSKLLLSGSDGATLETVYMRYKERATACISSQAGCPVGCGFCATGAMGLRRNLSVAEIVDQVRVVHAHAHALDVRLSNLVYMGMGEPLLNLRAVLDSIRIVTDPLGLGMSHRAISVSTIGIPAGMRTLARTEPQVNLALSLHAADDGTRALLIPQTFRHPISEVLDAAWEHFSLTGRKLLVEYVLLQGINDSTDDARRLAGLLRGHVATVNLLPWNPVSELSRGPTRFRAPSPSTVAAFRQALLDSHVEAVVRRSKGAGIDAACGQLAGRSPGAAGSAGGEADTGP